MLKTPPFPLDKGFQLLEEGDYHLAENFFQKALTQAPEDPHSYMGLGHALHGQKHYRKALNAYRDALKFGSLDIDIYRYIGNTAYTLGDWQLAKESYILDFSKTTTSQEFQESINALPRMSENFEEHYVNWRHKRLKKVISHYGVGWFNGKRLMELGCGHGDIGMHFNTLGADVSFLEGRLEHIQSIKYRYPDYPQSRLFVRDLNKPFNLPEKSYDLIIHFGLLYHLRNWKESLADCKRHAKYMVLETEVCDSDDPDFFLTINEAGYDQALDGCAIRASGPAIEKYLKELGYEIERVTDASCNSDPHVYDWEVRNTQGYGPEFRRMWFCKLT